MAQSESQSELETDEPVEPVDIIDITRDARIESRIIPDFNKCRSRVYSHFTWNQDIRMWSCNHCRKKYVHHKHSGSSVLDRHLKTHPLEYKSKNDSSTASPSGLLREHVIVTQKIKEKDVEPLTKEGVKERLLKFIVTTDQPFCVTEDNSFKELLRYCSQENPAVNIPCTNTIRSWITESFLQEKTKLKNEIQANEGKVSLILDGWTSSNQISFQGVIACWVDNDWNLRTCVIDFTLLEGPHTGDNLAAALAEVLDEYDLWNKIMAITTDNASNMDTFFRKFDVLSVEHGVNFSSTEFRIRCLAHIVNLCCRAILDNISPANRNHCETNEEEEVTPSGSFVNSIRNAVIAIRSSPQRRQIYSNECGRFKLKHLELIRDVSTRWNSTLDMLLRAREMKAPLESTLANISELHKYKLSEDMWKNVDMLIDLLGPFKESTVKISNGKNPTLTDTSFVYQALFAHLEKYPLPTPPEEQEKEHQPSTRTRRRGTIIEPVWPNWLTEAANKGWEKLKKYYPSSEGFIYVAATVLDPRLKLHWYKAVNWETSWQRDAKKKIERMWDQTYNSICRNGTSESANSTLESQSGIDSEGCIFDKLVLESMRDYQKPEDELKRYLSESVVNPILLKNTGGVLAWWKAHEGDYPTLSKMARDVMSAAGSGVAVERLFSMGPDLLTARRQSLSSEKIKECICLKYWLKRNSDDPESSNMLSQGFGFKAFGRP